VLHFFYKGQLNIASLCNGRTKRKWNAMLNRESGDRIELFYEDSPEATIRATVNRLLTILWMTKLHFARHRSMQFPFDKPLRLLSLAAS
jgi:hypothetical protein